MLWHAVHNNIVIRLEVFVTKGGYKKKVGTLSYIILYFPLYPRINSTTGSI